MEIFHCKTKLVCGSGACDYLKDQKFSRLLVVADPYFSQSGQAQAIGQLSGGQWRVFDRFTPDPAVAQVAQGVAVMQEFLPDAVVALGGGSAIDCAKGMVYAGHSRCPLIAIPTTSGSGSEVTDFAVLTHEQVKHPLVDRRIRPDVAILDSDLLTKLPKSLVADGGFDAISHGVEAYVATGASSVTDALAADAFATVFAHLSASFSGDVSVRQRIHTASAMAGMAFSQAGLGLCHAMSHAMGGIFHIPHGRLNAILLPAVIRCNSCAAGSKYAKLARFAGLGGSAETVALRNLQNGLCRLRRELRLPQTLAEAGVDPRQVWQVQTRIVTTALADPCCKTNPLPVADFMVRRILEEVTGRG